MNNDEKIEFTQEELEIARRMSDLSKTKTWEDIVGYLDQRKKLARGSLESVDPFKEPTIMARNQGVLMGLDDFPQYVKMLVEMLEKYDNQPE